MNSFFTSLLQPQIRRKRKGIGSKVYVVPCDFFSSDVNSELRERNFDPKKGDIVYVSGHGLKFWSNQGIIEPGQQYDSEGISLNKIFPFLVTDYKFSPDHCFGFHFRFSKIIKKRIMSNFDSKTNTSRFMVGRKEWVFKKEWWPDLPFTKSSTFLLDGDQIVSFTPHQDFHPHSLFIPIWKRIRKWYAYNMG